MTAIALKQYITNRIIDIDDDVILEKIRILIDSNSEKVYELSEFQIKRLEESRIQFQNGEYIDQTEMNKKMSEWLSQK